MDEKQRVIQEYVPGKQVTLAHLIAGPDHDMTEMVGLGQPHAIGIMTLTPSETTLIAADLATKAADVKLGFLDRFTGSLVITGEYSAVQVALTQVVSFLANELGYTPTKVTRS